jgi:HlyD family secretion protein
MKRRNWILVSSVAILILFAIIYSASGKKKESVVETEAKFGTFEIMVNVTGELQAEKSQEITGPIEIRNNRELRFNDIRIQDLVAEGTIVKVGDFVAKLDGSQAANTLKDIRDEADKANTKYNNTKLDTSITLRNLRDELINLKFSTEEASIKLEQSKFEPPATIRQAQIELDKTKRNLEQAKKNYHLKEQQAIGSMNESSIEQSRANRKLEEMQNILTKFTITAPAEGMVIYHREWGGAKRKVGSTISPWDLAVAVLPDLTSMITKTYVNEIDISKIKVGQKVTIGIDAFPDKKYAGVVSEVANIGEQLPNTDAKVFEVIIKLNGTDPILRPSMTTNNAILINRIDSVIYLPLEAVHSNDSANYVYSKNGTRQIVVLGETNENEVIIEKGIKAGEKVYLSVPETADKYKFTGTELVKVIRQKEQEKKKKEELLKAQQEQNMKMPQGPLPPGKVVKLDKPPTTDKKETKVVETTPKK